MPSPTTRPPTPPLPTRVTDSPIPLPLPVAPYLVHTIPPPPTFTISPRCTPTSGRLLFTAARVHRHLPNLCRQWGCWYCATFRASQLLTLLALHHDHDRRHRFDPLAPPPRLAFYQLPQSTLQRRIERADHAISRLTITRQVGSRERLLSITSHPIGPPGRGGCVADDLPSFFDTVAATAFPLPGVVRARWSGWWSDTAPDHTPVEIPLRDIPRHLLPSVLDLAVDAAVKRWGVPAWSPLTDSLPRAIPDAWWFRELRRAAEIFA